jgi:hypothetical protein
MQILQILQLLELVGFADCELPIYTWLTTTDVTYDVLVYLENSDDDPFHSA